MSSQFRARRAEQGSDAENIWQAKRNLVTPLVGEFSGKTTLRQAQGNGARVSDYETFPFAVSGQFGARRAEQGSDAETEIATTVGV
ncbi:MAG: hypothetical protein J5J00_00035 [Deltaproteobacteria bacterium]|nr:hypothetical protein [Deltaproteobacteria bacterium]